MKTKEQLIRELPLLAAELRRGMASCLSDMVAFAFEEDRKHERYFFAAAMKVRYRLERIAELTLLLPTLPYELVPAEELERISADAADAWWVTKELRRANEEMGEAVRAAAYTNSRTPSGADLLDARLRGSVSWSDHTDAAHRSHWDAVRPTPPSYDVVSMFQAIDIRCQL